MGVDSASSSLRITRLFRLHAQRIVVHVMDSMPVVNHGKARHQVLTRLRHESNCSRTARSGKASRSLCGRWSEKKLAGAKTGSRSRSSSSTRCSKVILNFLAKTEVGRKSDGQRAHRWRTRNQTAKPRSGKRENARNTLHKWRRKRGRWEWGGRLGGGGLSITFSFSFSHFLFHMCQPSKGGGGGARRPHRDGDLRRIRSGGEKRVL